MRLGSLLMPSHPPETSIKDGIESDLAELERLDRLGFGEAWIGEHFTASWEPCPAPDLLIAQGLQRTKNIRLGPLGHLLPYHHPVELAHRCAYLDHMSQGRYQLGVGISALPTDHALFAIEAAGGRNREMTFESIDIMTRIWNQGPGEFAGKYWSMGAPSSSLPGLGFHLTPYQQPHPPIAIAGLTPNSANHKLAGEKGYIPVSLSVDPGADITAQHWDAVVEGAAKSGRIADRSGWRIIRDIFVAPTDAEARQLAMNGPMARCWREFLLPIYLGLGLGTVLKTDPDMPDDAIDLDYLADKLWLVGSPDTVTRRIQALQDATGGFGVMVGVSYESRGCEHEWDRSLRLLAEEVAPGVSMPPGGATAAGLEDVA